MFGALAEMILSFFGGEDSLHLKRLCFSKWRQ